MGRPKLVVCDLDGTLLTPEHRVGEMSRALLARLGGQGIELVLASGRHFLDIRRLSDLLGPDGCLISSNGAAIHDRRGGLIQSTAIDPACVPFLIRDPAFRSVHINVYRSTDWVVGHPKPDLLRYHRDSGFAYRVRDLGALPPVDILKVFYAGEPADLHRLEYLIIQRCGDRVSTTFSLPVTLEVMAREVSKGAALRRVAERLGVDLADVIAFGDGLNDREMLVLAGTGVLMANADPRLADALPHLERIGSNRDESVARYLADRFLRDP